MESKIEWVGNLQIGFDGQIGIEMNDGRIHDISDDICESEIFKNEKESPKVRITIEKL